MHASVEIGSCVCINDGVQILTASHDVRSPNWPLIAQPIVVRDHAWIAVNALILPGVTIGRGAVVGAGAVVAKDVPDYAVVVGNPAQVRVNARCHELNYNPTCFLGFQAAWLGRPIVSVQKR
ncbi:MAG: acyltransferase [Verrucomicrobiota bacterium]|jgi:maltose O-acetyltransferase